MMKYVLQGPPIPLKRPRLTTFRKIHAYDSQKELKKEIILEIVLQRKSPKLLNGPLGLNVTFLMQIPASCSKKKKMQLLGSPHIKRPDVSNMLKFLEDVCQGVLIEDDSTITEIIATKEYSDHARTEFSFTKLGEANNGT